MPVVGGVVNVESGQVTEFSSFLVQRSVDSGERRITGVEVEVVCHQVDKIDVT